MRRARAFVAAALATLSAPPSARATAQGPRTVTVRGPAVEFPESFSYITAVRVLPDGRVIVIDARDRIVQLLDMQTGTMAQVGRTGRGPAEYLTPSDAIRAGDTTWVRDALNPYSFLVVDPNGKAIRRDSIWLRTDRPRRFVYFADDKRRVYTSPDLSGSDTAWIERYSPGTRRYDTLGAVSRRWVSPLPVPDPYTSTPSTGSGRGRGPTHPVDPIPVPPFATMDQWLVSPDGRVAIVQARPYRVTFIDENGRKTIGAPIQYTPIPVTATDRAAHIEAFKAPPRVTYSTPGAPAPPLPPPPPTPREWPSAFPPFTGSPFHFAEDGTLWIPRRVGAGQPPLVDVVDPRGRLAMRVTLPKGTTVAAITKTHLYLVRTDSDDLTYLQRYPVPR